MGIGKRVVTLHAWNCGCMTKKITQICIPNHKFSVNFLKFRPEFSSDLRILNRPSCEAFEMDLERVHVHDDVTHPSGASARYDVSRTFQKNKRKM